MCNVHFIGTLVLSWIPQRAIRCSGFIKCEQFPHISSRFCKQVSAFCKQVNQKVHNSSGATQSLKQTSTNQELDKN